MRFLHTSDWHLGMTVGNARSYIEDQRFMLERICEIAESEKVDGILLAGDVFDKSIASQEGLQLFDDMMHHICGELQIPVYLIAGNHDGAERLSQHDRLLTKSGLHIAGVLSHEPRVIRKDGVAIWLLPWITTDRVRAEYEEIKNMEDAYRVVLDDYRSQFVPGEKNILVAHAFVTGAETSVSDRAAEVGTATMVGKSVFDGFDYVALGHLHGPQRVSDTIRYAGTPMAYSFGKEERQIKSVVIVDTEAEGEDMVRLTPIPQLHARLTMTGTYEELTEGKAEKQIRVVMDMLRKQMPEGLSDVGEYIRDGYVRLEVTDRYVGYEAMTRLREIYPNALEFSGQSIEEKSDSQIRMTVDELDEVASDPEALFIRYFEEMIGEEPDEHVKEMFGRAVQSIRIGQGTVA